jgi:hypothetical protein
MSTFRTAAVAMAVLYLVASGPARANGLGPHPEVPTSGGGHVDRSGFAEHLVHSMMEGVLVGGLVGIAVSDPADAAATRSRMAVGALLGAGIGLVTPLLLNQTGTVRTGDIIFINAAQNWGLAHGFLVPLMVQSAGCSRAGCPPGGLGAGALQLDAGLAAGLSLLAGVGAAQLAPSLNFTPGQAETISSAGLWGAWGAYLLVTAVFPAGAPPTVMMGSLLAGANAAMLTAWSFRDAFDIDRTRVLLMSVGVGLGALLGSGLAYFINPQGSAGPTLLPLMQMGGSVTGLLVAYYASAMLDGFKQSAPPEGRTAALVSHHQGSWQLGVPAPRPVLPTAGAPGSLGAALDVLGGSW